MIRKHTDRDLEHIINIWYQSSSLAHPFLSTALMEKVKQDMTHLYIPNSETWVYEKEHEIQGFISMINNEIGGLFVLPKYHSKGIGTQLVNFVKTKHKTLEVEVFEQNKIGRAFYNKYGFKQITQYRHEESDRTVLRLSYG